MRTVVVYYTFGGSTKREAERLGMELNAPVYRVREAHGRGLFGSFVPGCLQAMKRKASRIEPPAVNLGEFDRIALGSPVWAAYPAPAFNAMVALLPEGKTVDLFFCEAGSDPLADEAGTKALVEARLHGGRASPRQHRDEAAKA